MFDPHRTRRSDKRYYTRKGQVIQASRVNTKPIIDQRLVPVYKNYLITNNLISPPSPPIPPSTKITIDAVSCSNIPAFPTNQLGFSGAEGGEIQLDQYTAPRILFTLQERGSDYLIIIFMHGNSSTAMVDSNTYYVVFGLGGQVSDYDIKLLSGDQTVFSVQDQLGEPDFTTLILTKSKYSISLPA